MESDWAVSEQGRRARDRHATPTGREALTAEEARWARYVAAMGRPA